MQSTTARLALIAASVVVLVVAFIALRPGDNPAATQPAATSTDAAARGVANLELTGIDDADDGLRGVAMLGQDGDRVRGYVAMWGLEPGSEHAAHIHGPDAACAAQRRTKRHAVELPDLVADEQGVAYRRIDLPTEGGEVVNRPGYYVMVHRDAGGHSHGADAKEGGHSHGGGENPGIACGAVGDADALAVTGELPDGGDPSAQEAEAPGPEPTATVRVRDGAPVGEAQDIEVRRGDAVRIEFRSDAPGEVHIHGVDEYVDLDADEAVTATFEAQAEGIYEIENHDNGELLANLEVQPR